jgi:hypothetical protein
LPFSICKTRPLVTPIRSATCCDQAAGATNLGEAMTDRDGE